MAFNRRELKALKSIIIQVGSILEGADPLPQNRTDSCLELLRSAVDRTDYLIKRERVKPTALIGQVATTTAGKYGPEHHRQVAANRKTRAGGRPRNPAK